ncbi:hypothetical protein [Anaerotignum sp.]|uniref:GNAT family N-acetyltransferase n=1 Tax=Anaerotignum sp. TaxID=2039241 RepID=UPI00331E49B3
MNRKFACNALTDNEPIDIFMTKAKRNESFALRYLLSYVNSILGVIVSKEGRKVISKFKVIAFMDQKFFSQSKLHFGGELDYVGVRTDQRGGGLDKKLFHKCMEYLDRQNMKSFYFFTDSTCNVGFYKHQGMSQIGGQRDALKFLERGELALYLFASNSPGRLCQ